MKIGILVDERTPAHVKDSMQSSGSINIDSFKSFESLSKAIDNGELHGVVMYEPDAEMIKVSVPYAVVAGSTYNQPSKSVAKFPTPGTMAMSAAATRMMIYGVNDFYGGNLPEPAIAALDDDDDDFVPVVPKTKEMTDRDKESLRIASTIPIVKSNRPDPNRMKKSRGRGKKIALPDGGMIPDGTKMVHINWRGYNAFAIIEDQKIVFNGVAYDSLTACSNEVTHAIAEFAGLNLGERNGKKNQARTTGTRNWFPEDTPENDELRKQCHPDVRKTEGVKWQSVAIAENPDGAPKRGRPAKEKPAQTVTVPAEVEEAEETDSSETATP